MKNETCNIRAYECPVCKAPDRARLYALFLNQWFKDQGIGSTYRFLDFAPFQSLSEYILKQAELYCQNIAYVTADLVRDNVDVNLDITDMQSIADESFDFFICSHILEHVSDDEAALKELFRILKKGCKGIIMVPINLNAEHIDEDLNITSPSIRWSRFGQDDHVRMYDKKGFMSRVSSVGFEIREVTVRDYSRRQFYFSGITQRSVLYVVEKHMAS